MVGAPQRRAVARHLQKAYGISERRSCELAQVSRSVMRYQSKRALLDISMRKRIRDIALTRVRYGYKRVHVLLRREGVEINHKTAIGLNRSQMLN